MCSTSQHFFNVATSHCEECPPPGTSIGILLGTLFGILAIVMALWFVLEYMKPRNARAKAFRLGIVLMMRRLHEKASCMSLVPKVP